MNFDPSQLQAIDAAAAGHDCAITGGAGTGKTTVIAEIADRLSGGAPDAKMMEDNKP